MRIANTRNGLDITLCVSISKSAITVHGATERYDPADFGLIFRRALHLTNASVDIVAFATATGLRIILDEFIGPDKKRMPIQPRDPRFAPHCTAYGLDETRQFDFDDVYRIVATKPALFLALNDLITGLYLPDEGPIVCARAIESLRRLFAPKDVKPSAQWPYMHTALGVTEEYLKPITIISAGPRHGDRTVALDGDLVSVAERSWVIMNRCLEYYKRGEKPLPEAEFPILT